MKRKLVNAHEFLRLANSNIKIPYMKDIPVTQRNCITQKQRNYLHSMGIGYSQLKYYGQITPVLKLAIQREKAGLATPAQMRRLDGMGYSNVHLRTKHEAAFLLDGNDEEEYDGFVVIFRYGENKRVTACSRTQAHDICVWMKERKYLYEYKIL